MKLVQDFSGFFNLVERTPDYVLGEESFLSTVASSEAWRTKMPVYVSSIPDINGASSQSPHLWLGP